MSKFRVPFQRQTLEGEERPDTFTVKLNIEERSLLNQVKLIIKQQKDSTAIKQMFQLGTKVLLDEKTAFIIETLIENKRKNKRTGINEIDTKL